jgi:hypothetical protein
MNFSKTKKKVALIKAACYSLELHPRLKSSEDLQEAMNLATQAGNSLDNENTEKLEESRSLCEKSLNLIRKAIEGLTPNKVRKALDRQLEKISKY